MNLRAISTSQQVQLNLCNLRAQIFGRGAVENPQVFLYYADILFRADNQELQRMNKRVKALKNFLGNDVRVELLYDHTYAINPRKVKEGPSPEDIKQRVFLLKQALELAFPGKKVYKWNSTHFNPKFYHEAEKRMHEKCEGLLRVGIHDVLNTMYFLYAEAGYGSTYHLDVRTVFDGGVITDKRPYVSRNSGEYMVLTDEEADQAWDNSLESYIDECLTIPKEVEPYFNREKWKRDARRDGRGHSLSSYDGAEHSTTVAGADYHETLYIYRMN